jgi:rRNA biogenesis protein RRP5
MCHKSEAADHNIADLTEAYEPGDLVKAVILKVDEGQRRVSLGLKASYFTGDDAESDESEDEGEGGSSDEEDEGIPRRTVASADENEEEDSDKGDSSEDEEEEEEEEESGAMMNVDDSKESDDDNDNDDDAPSASEESDSDEELDMASPWQEAGKGRSTTPGGSLTVPFDGFDSGPAKHLPSDDGSNSDSDDGEGAEGQSAGHKSRRKASEKRKEEERVARREKALLEGDLEPETAADFDREIMARPNDSFIWLKYMAFQLGLADVEGARAVAERALKTIIFREEQERFNVWNALLNLEHKYGSRSSLEAAVKKASANSHPKKIHLRLCAIYDEAGETEASEEAYERASKKFRSSKQLWMAWQRARLARGDEEGARALLRRSLKSLSEHKHVRVVSSFAMAAFELDCVDAGREVFEGLVASHPKRIDLWNLYVDKEAKMGFVPQARALLERMITLPLSATRIKSVFKKFLKFELRYGSDATQIAVREKAKAYVQSLAA